MLKNKQSITAFLIAVLMIISFTNKTAFADELPDLSIKGTITISMKKDGESVPGGEFEIYHIADISITNQKSKYVFTKDFKKCGLSLDNIKSDEFSADLESYINSNKIKGIKKSIDENGVVEFNKLAVGLYFIIQNEAAEGYSKASSFTVSLPVLEDGKYNYIVNANPKFSLINSEYSTKTTTTTTKKKDDLRLPKTGQLNLPIPVLTASGICMLVLGLIIRHNGRKEENEE